MNVVRLVICLTALFLPLPTLAQFAGGTGSTADPYQIENAAQLDEVRHYLGSNFVQVASFDAASFANWVPIGTSADPFTGTYRGGSNTISNLTIDRPDEDHVGLFGYVNSPGWIRYLTLSNASVVGSNAVGGVAGFNESTAETIECHVQGAVIGTGNHVGGLFGRHRGTLSDSSADADVEGVDVVGGLVGGNMPYHSYFTVHRSVMRGTVTGASWVAGIGAYRGRGNDNINYASIEGQSGVGGLFGYVLDSAVSYGVNYGSVTATGNTVGGIVAYHYYSGSGSSAGTSYSYNLGDVTGGSGVGGIIGSSHAQPVSFSYNRGAISGTSSVGGILGTVYRSIHGPSASIAIQTAYNAGPVTGSSSANAMMGSRSATGTYTLPYIQRGYYDNQLSGLEDSLAFPRSTAEMIQQITFLDWDFNTIWSIGHEGEYTYPYMQWQGTNDIPYVDLTIPFVSDVYAIGTDSVGETLTGHYTYHPNSAGDSEGVTTFRWLRADTQGGPFVEITGATNQAYTLVAGDENKWYQFEVTVRDTEDNVGAPVSAVLEFTQGRGTADDPWLIGNAMQLDRLRTYLGSTHSAKHFALMADIDLGTAPWNEGAGWEPIGYSATESFRGKLNGRGHVIRNLTINRPADNYQGLFGYLNGADIVLLGLEDAYVVGNRYVGGLAGFSASSGIRHGYVHGDVEGTQDTGGFIGYNTGSTIQWSYSAAAVTGGVTNVGGFLGFGAAHACYWDVEVSGQESSGNGTGQTGLSTAEMQQQESFVGWNFYSLWQIEADPYPAFQDLSSRQDALPLTLDDLNGAGTVEAPYLVGHVHELNAMRIDLSAHYRLTNDFDAADTVLWDMARGWTPVGSSGDRFTGSLDGAGHTISNLTIVRPGTTYQALFGYTENARIANLTLSRAYVLGANYTAGLAAFASGTEMRGIVMEDLYVEGSAYTGGLVGYAQSGCAMEFVRVQGMIQGANDTGGLAGYVSGGTVHACETDVTVSGGTYVGGLIGRAQGLTTIYQSRSQGSVTGINQVGGLVGHAFAALLSDCYSHATVEGGSNAGGLIGYMGGSATASRVRVYRSFSTGAVTGSSAVGGLVGAIANASHNFVFDGYWDTDTSGLTNSVLGVGHDTATMQSEGGYPPFNFTTRWEIDEGNAYPELRDMSAYPQPQSVDLAELDGEGTAEDPYVIMTLDHLNAVRQDVTAHYRLGADIDATPTVAWDAGRGWAPVGVSASRFTGSLDGAGYAIENLAISRPATTYQALFAYAQNAVLQDVNLVNANVHGAQYVGGLIADANGTRVEFVRVQGMIRGDNDTGGLLGYVVGGAVHACRANVSVSGATAVGGLIGRTAGGVTIYHSHSSGDVSGVSQVGGLAGQLFAALLTDCYSHATVVGGSNAGGLVGYMAATATASRARVFRSYSAGAVTGSSAVGGLVGGVSAAGHNIEAESYWDMDTSGLTNSVRGTGMTTADMQQQATFAKYNFHALWQIDEGNAYPEFRDLAAYAPRAEIPLDLLDGSGTVVDPYLINTLDELDAVRLGPTNHFRLAADIDAAPTAAWAAGLGWAPVGPSAGTNSFQGSLDGGGHSISNLTVNRPLADNIGLFGVLSGAQISDLKLTNVNVCGQSSVGALAGQAVSGSTIDVVRVSGIVMSHSTYAGGLIGFMSGGSMHRAVMDGIVDSKGQDTGGLVGMATGAPNIQSSYAVGRVSGVNNVGGLVGNHGNATLTDCYSHMAVNGGSSVGGAVGVNGGSIGNNGFLYRVYSAGAVDGTGTGVGGMVGTYSRGTVNEGYWDMDTSGQTNSARGTGFTTEDMKQAATYRLHNFVTLWEIDEGNDYPVFQDLSGYAQPADVVLADLDGDGTEATPYLITNADELNAMRQDLTAHYRLANDIDLSASVIWNAGQGWAPLGDSVNKFSGSLDGAGYTISNLVVTRPNVNYQGLFGYLSGGAVRHVNLVQTHVYGGSFVGALAGRVDSASAMDTIHVTGIVGSQSTYAGGLMGFMSGGTMNRAVTDGMVDSKGNDTGGLIGMATGAAHIQSSYAIGSVGGVNNVGGLVGNHGNATLTDCYSRMTVNGGSSVGGAVGVNGGAVGNNGHLYRVYSAGAIEGTGANIGGLVGVFSRGTVNESYWDMDSSGQTNSVRGDGRTTAEMTYPRNTNTTYVGWDFVEVWSEDVAALNAGYPRLLNPDERNLIYAASVGGVIMGPNPQVVLAGSDGAQVEALPDDGAEFDQWSDGHTDNPRTDTNVTDNLAVTAYFMSSGGTPIDWFTEHDIERDGEDTWADVDQRYDPDKRMTLAEQFIADLDPNEIGSLFYVYEMDAGVSVHFHSSTGRLYTLHGTFDLKNGAAWTHVPGAGPRMGVGGPDTMTDTNEPPAGMIYRIGVQLP